MMGLTQYILLSYDDDERDKRVRACERSNKFKLDSDLCASFCAIDR
jgi:hypothetical protein